MGKEAIEIIAFQKQRLRRRSGDRTAQFKLGVLEALLAAVKNAVAVGALPTSLPQFSKTTEPAKSPTSQAVEGPVVRVTPVVLDRQLRDALRPFVQEYKDAKVHTPELINHTWKNFWQVVGEAVDHKYQIPSCDRTAEELAELREQGRAVLLLPADIYTPSGLVRLGWGFPLMRSWTTDPVKASGIQHKFGQGGCVDIETSFNAPYRTANGYTEQQLKIKIAEDSQRLKRPLAGQRLPTYLVGSQFSELSTGEYFDLRTWSRLPGSVCEGKVLGASFHPDGNVYVDDWSPQAQFPDLGGRSEGRKS